MLCSNAAFQDRDRPMELEVAEARATRELAETRAMLVDEGAGEDFQTVDGVVQ